MSRAGRGDRDKQACPLARVVDPAKGPAPHDGLGERHLPRRVLILGPIRPLSRVFRAAVLLIGYLEGWRVIDALYFTFVTGLTIGYGDLTPQHAISRILAIVIGFAGILLTGLVARIIGCVDVPEPAMEMDQRI